MRNGCYRALASHLKKNLEKGATLALALSGGPDSMALYHLLVEAQDHFDFSLVLLHVDHGWREESAQEAETLSKLPHEFFSKRLDISGKNLEERCRKARYTFFEEMAKERHFSAVLLAHHLDDQAETVLKRVFEGANLDRQGAMRPVSMCGELTLWRPLLRCTKKELKNYLKGRDHFTDPTNGSCDFLRGRMRKKIIPELEEVFGKKISGALASHAEKMHELDHYLERQVGKYWEAYRDGVLNLDKLGGIEPVEFSYFLRQVYQSIPAKIIEDFLEIIEKKLSGKRVMFSEGEILYKKGRVETNFLPSGRLNNCNR